MIRIILNADDFGKSVERNRAIDDCFKQNLICSAGLIVTGKHLREAVDFINKGGYAEKIHLHFNLSTNLLHEDSDDVPLTEGMKNDPFFCKDEKFVKYSGLPRSFRSVRKWLVVYRELVAQYKMFFEVTGGKADYKHVDFHLWYNLTWPVSVALNLFTIRYRIKTVRYIGIHQMGVRRYKLLRFVSWTPLVKYIPATNIDYFLSKRQLFDKYHTIELYCHPNYKDEIFLDDSPSYLHHDRQPILKHVRLLKESGNIKFISWNEQ